MGKFDKITKWLLVVITIIFVLYTLLWVLVTYTLANHLEKTYAGKKSPLSKDATISFSKVRAAGYPFKFMLEFIDFEEENTGSLISHKEPFRVGYDLLSQMIFSEYSGESTAKYKPLDTGFGARINGTYRMQAKVPFNASLLRVLMMKSEPIVLVNYVNDFNINSRDVSVYDLVDNSVIIDDADMDIKFQVLHHEYYDTLDELIADIPNDYHFSFSTNTKDAAPGRKPVPFSMIYWTYLPTDLSYNIDLDLHTEAKEFSIEDIFKNFTIKTNKLSFYSKAESSVSELQVNKKEAKESSDIGIDYKTKLRLGAEFNDYIAGSMDAAINSIPRNSPIIILKDYLQTIDIKRIDLSTGDDEIELFVSASAKKISDKMNVDISRLGIFLKDKGFDIKMSINNNFGGEWMSGLVQVANMEEVVRYIVSSYFKISKSQSNPVIMGDEFWIKLYVDYLKSIANNYNEENGNVAIEFKINKDVTKSKWGRYTAPESSLLYYKKLYMHLKPHTSDKHERLTLFRRMVPTNVDTPEILEKVTKE